MPELSFKSATPFEDVPPFITVAGNKVTLELHDETTLLASAPEGVSATQVALLYAMMFGKEVTPMLSLPGEFKTEQEDVTPEIERLIVEQDLELEELRKIQEPVVELNISDPNLPSMVPLGKKIWDSVFAKAPPVLDLPQWLQSKESDEYVYLPNDSSKVPTDTEEVVSNAMYTEVLVNAYALLCQRHKLNFQVRLTNGVVLNTKGISPMQGTQHTVLGEVSGRLANSKIVNDCDSKWAKEYLACICDLKDDQFEREPIRRRVLSKVEHILMGRTSHTYNQRFIHAFYDRLVNEASEDDPWAAHRVPLTHCIMNVLKQLVAQGLVLEDSHDALMSKMKVMGFGVYMQPISDVFHSCKATGGAHGK